MSEQTTASDSPSFFEDFGPMHEVWIRFERGMQIMLGVALITLFGFLGESWGADNVPYDALVAATFRIGWAFTLVIFLSPGVMLFILIARQVDLLTRKLRGILYLSILLGTLLYCWSLLYISTVEVINAMIKAVDIVHPAAN